MKHITLRQSVRLAALGLAFAAGLAANAAVISDTNNLPPPGVYLTDNIHALYTNGALAVLLKRPEHAAIVADIQRRTQGSNEIENFQSTLTGTANITNGASVMVDVPIFATGPVQTIVRGKVGTDTGAYDTEMLAMSLNGNAGGIPYIIRESPTKDSTGRTSIRAIAGGKYSIESFFDVNTELSVDNGATWIPAAAPVHVTLQSRQSNPIPTVSQWGVIILALLLLTVGTIYLRRQQRALAANAA